MLLSKLIPNLRSRDVQRDVGNAHAMHQRVLSGFPDQGLDGHAREEFGILYRVDRTSEGVSVLVQSHVSPTWERLPSDYLAATFEPNPATRSLEPLLGTLHQGQVLRFRVRANPTRRLPPENGKKRGGRVELIGDERLITWLLRKSSGAGFDLSPRSLESDDLGVAAKYAVRITEEPKVRARRAGAVMTFGSVLFDGRLVVTEPGLFVETLKRGIGTAKAYGFGLVSVASA
jgi:CRISPR system Cascade subunit CasE